MKKKKIEIIKDVWNRKIVKNILKTGEEKKNGFLWSRQVFQVLNWLR